MGIKSKGSKFIPKLKEIKGVFPGNKTMYYFDFQDGRVQQRFVYATEFSDFEGIVFAIVQEEENGKFRAINATGQLSHETFENPTLLFDNIIKKGGFTFTDKDLEVYSMSKKGPDFASLDRLNKYFRYEVTIYELTPDEILVNLEKIQKFEEMNYLMALEHCSSKQSMQKFYDDYLVVTEYIKQTAYEATSKAKRKANEDRFRAEFKEKPLF